MKFRQFKHLSAKNEEQSHILILEISDDGAIASPQSHKKSDHTT
jgi:hypothetical protein